jgi:predicted transcriptional regulator
MKSGLMNAKKNNILKLKNRRDIYTLVLNNPGVYVMEISKILDIPKSTVNYHLRFLERKNLLRSEKKGKFTIYFVANNLGKLEKFFLKYLRNNISCRILFLTILFDEIYIEEISRAHDRPINTVIYHLKNLEKDGLLEVKKYKKRVAYSINNREYFVRLLENHYDKIIEYPFFLDYYYIVTFLNSQNKLPIVNTHKKDIDIDVLIEIFYDIFPVFFSC